MGTAAPAIKDKAAAVELALGDLLEPGDLAHEDSGVQRLVLRVDDLHCAAARVDYHAPAWYRRGIESEIDQRAGSPGPDGGFQCVTGDEYAVCGEMGDTKSGEQHQHRFPGQHLRIVDVVGDRIARVEG